MNIIMSVFEKSMEELRQNGGIQSFTSIKTDKSLVRFRKAINHTLLKYKGHQVKSMVSSMLKTESITPDSLLLLFWNSSFNNDLLGYLNRMVFFPAFYSGRITIKQDEVYACIMELKQSEPVVRQWSASTVDITSSKYLTLLRKFGLMEGRQNKTIVHPYLDNKMFVLFAYWLKAMESRSNLLESQWLSYSFSEKKVFVERILSQKYSKYFQLIYTGDSLKIEPIVPYEKIYYALIES